MSVADDPVEVASRLRRSRRHFGAIIETPDRVHAFVDRIRSYPIFFCTEPRFVVSNDARIVRAKAGLRRSNDDAVLEFAMTGYVTGRETVQAGLQQLRPGEALTFDRKSGATSIQRYYRYVPTFPDLTTNEYLDRLADTTDTIMRRLVKDVGDTRIFLFLSGGFDSRLILSKLIEFGCENITTVGYGRPNNHEVEVAQRIASDLGVRWLFLPSPRGQQASRMFESKLRKEYWEYADGLASTPIMHDFMPMAELVRRGELQHNDIILNGLSGDFISGGHIPQAIAEANEATDQDLIRAVIEKHYSLWSHLKSPSNVQLATRRITSEMPPGGDSLTKADLAARYEAWECQERQCKYMVNNQRLYEFFGCEWRLPFWDGEYMDFWSEVPLDLKYRQRLYLEYLARYDYRGVFSRYPNPVWAGYAPWIRWPARLAGSIFGAKAKTDIYRRLMYFGPSAHEWSMHGIRTFLASASTYLHTISLFSRAWLIENGFPSPDDLARQNSGR